MRREFCVIEFSFINKWSDCTRKNRFSAHELYVIKRNTQRIFIKISEFLYLGT